MKLLSESVYRVLIHKKFRSGPTPGPAESAVIKSKILFQMCKQEPIKLFQFWGGCKNPNLPSHRADICENLTIQNLYKIHLAVKEIYNPGLEITLFPGDARVCNVNGVDFQKSKEYVDDLKSITSHISKIFTVVPVSDLYNQYAKDFENALINADKRIGNGLFTVPEFGTLVVNATKNIKKSSHQSQGEFLDYCNKAARGYIVYRVAEEEAHIYRDFTSHIRCSFIRFSPFFKFYNMYIDKIDEIQPSLGSVLHFYTGSKGNITQPWQAYGVDVNDINNKTFLSGLRLTLSVKQ